MMRSLSNDTFFYIKRTSTANVAEKESIPVAIPHRSTRARATKSTPVSKAAPLPSYPIPTYPNKSHLIPAYRIV